MICVLYAIFTAISRITDHKHHPTDVMAGAILGSVLAAATVHRILVAGTDLSEHQRRVNINKRLVEHVDVDEDQLTEQFLHMRSGDTTDGQVIKTVFKTVPNV